MRVGQYRVIYSEDGHILDVIRVGVRGDVYKA
ncbi:type II toxin-antitoxin system RelE family toxin [Thalassospira xiamenensis]